MSNRLCKYYDDPNPESGWVYYGDWDPVKDAKDYRELCPHRITDKGWWIGEASKVQRTRVAEGKTYVVPGTFVVVDTETGIEYKSYTAAAQALKVSRHRIHSNPERFTTRSLKPVRIRRIGSSKIYESLTDACIGESLTPEYIRKSIRNNNLFEIVED